MRSPSIPRRSSRRVAALLPLASALTLFLAGCASPKPGRSGDASASKSPFEPASPASIATLKDVDLRLTRLVVAGNSVRLPAATPVTLRFGDLGRIAGKSAVNRYFGTYRLTPTGTLEWPNAALGATRMAGPPDAMELEAQFMSALTRTSLLQLSPDKVRFQNADQSDLLEFQR